MHIEMRVNGTFSSIMLGGRIWGEGSVSSDEVSAMCMLRISFLCSDFLNGKRVKLKNRSASDVSPKIHGLEH